MLRARRQEVDGQFQGQRLRDIGALGPDYASPHPRDTGRTPRAPLSRTGQI